MADEQNKDQSTNDRLHSAEVSQDSVLNTTSISFTSIDQSNSYHGQNYSLENVHRPGGYPTLIHGLVFDRLSPSIAVYP